MPIDLTDIQRGDEGAFRSLYDQYRPDFISWSRKAFSLNRDEAAEIFQESVVTLYENVINGRLVELRSSLKTYLFAIGKNKAMERLRQNNRQVPLTEATPMEAMDPMEDLELSKEMMLRQTVMKQCIRELGQACQEILTLYYFNELTLIQICERLSYKNEQTVKSQKFKCMEQLRKRFIQKHTGRE